MVRHAEHRLSGIAPRTELVLPGMKTSIESGERAETHLRSFRELKSHSEHHATVRIADPTWLTIPESHGFAAENDSFPYELREMLVGGKKRTYRAIYTVVGTEVRVLTVRRAAQRAITPDDV
jgi:hypothetical protein